MRRPLMATTLIVAGTFGTGYVLGQVGGATSTFAAGIAKKHTPAKKAPATKKVATKKAATTKVQHADGQITAVNGNTITVKADADQTGSTEYTSVTTITLTASTQYEAGRDAAATTVKPTLTAGQYIVAQGAVSADGKTLTATLVSAHTGGPGHGGPRHAAGPHADGTVVSVNGDSIAVKADADQAGSNEYTAVTTITLTASTQFDAGKGNAPTTTKPAITAGEYIVADGTLSADGTTLTATHVSVRASGASGH